jgi:predicted transcriptional regulator
MLLHEILPLIDGSVITQSVNLARDVKGACGADLMSDVLASIKPEALLLTGLCNPQVVRTASISDVSAVIFVRGKTPPNETIELAELEDIPLISSQLGMFEICGRLYAAGLRSLESTITTDCPCE